MSLKAAGRPKIKSKVEGDIFVDGRKRMNAFFAGIKFGTFRVYLKKIRIKYGNSHSRLESHGRKMDTMGRIWISNALNSHRRRPLFILWIKGSHLGL